MTRRKTEGENFSVDTSPDSQSHASLLKGEAAGVITTHTESIDRSASLDALKSAFLRDAQLANDWEETKNEPGLARIEALLDRILAHRQELNESDADQSYKETRDTMFSDVANRLRELL